MPIILLGDDKVAVVHAGWRGLAAGVIERTLDAMGGASGAIVGAHIRVGCYEFQARDLDDVAAALGDHVRGQTVWGAPALDLTAGVAAACGGIAFLDEGQCTACSNVFPSWRARRESERFATIAWLEP